MPEKKTKLKKAKKIVEVSAELVEGEALPPLSEPESAAQSSPADSPAPVPPAPDEFPETPLSTQVAEAAPVALLHQKAPMIALKSTILRALPFVLVSFAIFSIPFLTAPDMSWFWLKYAQVRTYILCALIWNLIGSVLYAQVDKRLSRLLIVLIFALPLITSHGWAPLIYTIEMSLRSVLSLPP